MLTPPIMWKEDRIRSFVLVWLAVSVPQLVQSISSHTIALILPSRAEFLQLKTNITYEELKETYIDAIKDANWFYGHRLAAYHLDYFFLDSTSHPSDFISRFLNLLSDGLPPPVAMIGPFHVDRLSYIAPLAEMSQVPLVSPWIPLSQMKRFLPPSNGMSLSMQAAQSAHGDELIRIMEYHGWSHIAFVITQSPLQHHSPYQQNIRNIRYGTEALNVNVVVTAWIPPAEDYANDTDAFETAIAQEMEKIWNSGVTVIVLSIEQVTLTYEVLMRAADKYGLINNFTAWISLNVGAKSDLEWAINGVRPEVQRLLDGMIVTVADLNDYFNTRLSVVPHIFYPDKLKDPLAQLVYDSVWTVAIAVDYTLYAISAEKVRIGDLQFQRWTSGEEIVINIKRSNFVGSSGLVRFNNNERLTWYNISNIRLQHHRSRNVEYYGFGKLVIYRPIYWYNSAIRSPIGEVNICRHRINVLLAGGRYKPYIEYSSKDKTDRKYFGWAVELFEKAARKSCLNNIKYYSIPSITWNEAIDVVEDGYLARIGIQEYDGVEFHVVVGPLAITPERITKVDFTGSIKSVSYRVAILRPETDITNLWEFFKPFSWELWLLTFFFFAAGGFVVFVLERNRKRSNVDAPNVGDSIFISLSVFFYTNDQDSVISHSGRGYIAISWFVTLVLYACFTANLTVFLLRRQEISTYGTIEDIHDGVIGASNVTGALSYLQRAYPRLNFKDVSSEDWLERLISKKITAYVEDSSVLEFEAKTECKIKLLDNELRVINAAFALKHNSPYTKKLNDGIRHAWFDKDLEDLDQKYFEWADLCENGGEVAADDALNLHHLGGLFIILSAVTIMCLLGDLVRRYLIKAGFIDCSHEEETNTSQDATEVTAAATTAEAAKCVFVNEFAQCGSVPGDLVRDNEQQHSPSSTREMTPIGQMDLFGNSSFSKV